MVVPPRALTYPRSFVGTVYGQWIDDGTVILHFSVRSYEKAEAIIGHRFLGETVIEEGKYKRVTVKDFGSWADFEWIQKEFNKLLKAVKRARL